MDGKSLTQKKKIGPTNHVEGVVDVVLSYLPTAPGETLGPGDLGSDDDVNGVVFLSCEHRRGAASVRWTGG